MQLQFLCESHRIQLESDGKKAIHFWQVGFDTGHYFRDHLLWMDAISHLGCAFETAEILLSHKMVEHGIACELFSKSAMLLASSFNNLGHLHEAKEIIWMAINRMERELVDQPSKSECINSHLCDQYLQLKMILKTEQPLQGQESIDPVGVASDACSLGLMTYKAQQKG